MSDPKSSPGPLDPTRDCAPMTDPAPRDPPAPGKAVWVKSKSYQWPGYVVDPESPTVLDVVRDLGKPGKILVRFFGSHDFQWSPPASLSDYQEKREQLWKNTKKNMFSQAVEEADEFIKSGALPQPFSVTIVDVEESDGGPAALQVLQQMRKEQEDHEGKEGKPQEKTVEDEGVAIAGKSGTASPVKWGKQSASTPKENSPLWDQKPLPAGGRKRKLDPDGERKKEKRLKIMRILGLAPRPMTS